MVKALNYQKDAQIRRDAAIALGRSEGPQAVAGLTAAIKDGDPEVRFAVTQALVRLGHTGGIDGLAAAVQDEEVRLGV